MPNLTTNYSFNLPLVNDPIDEDLWGGQLNTNWTNLDSILPVISSSEQGAIVIQNAADTGFNTLSSQGTSGQPLLSQGSDADPAFGTLAVANGGTGATDAATARTNLGVVSATTSAEGLVELSTDAELETGTSTTLAVTPSNILNAMGFSEYFESAEQTISTSTTLTIAHGIGRAPTMIQIVLVCKTAEFGYSIGDKIVVNFGYANGSSSRGAGVEFNSTNVLVHLPNSAPCFQYINASTYAFVDLTNANWNLVVRAWG